LAFQLQHIGVGHWKERLAWLAYIPVTASLEGTASITHCRIRVEPNEATHITRPHIRLAWLWGQFHAEMAAVAFAVLKGLEMAAHAVIVTLTWGCQYIGINWMDVQLHFI